MPDEPPRPEPEDAPDVVLLCSPTRDGAGMQVLRAREGHLEAGEVRPIREGQPLIAGELVTLTPRAASPAICDVKVHCRAPSTASSSGPVDGEHKGPALVNSPEYRDHWDGIFAKRGPTAPN